MERADTLLLPSVHVSYSVSALGEVATDSLIQEISCSGVTCVGAGVTLDLKASILTDLIDPNIDISASEANLQSRDDGFDTAFIKGNLDASDIGVLLPEITIAEIPEALGYGFWGKHGMAGLTLADGPFSGRASNIPFGGDMTVVIPFRARRRFWHEPPRFRRRNLDWHCRSRRYPYLQATGGDCNPDDPGIVTAHRQCRDRRCQKSNR